MLAVPGYHQLTKKLTTASSGAIKGTHLFLSNSRFMNNIEKLKVAASVTMRSLARVCAPRMRLRLSACLAFVLSAITLICPQTMLAEPVSPTKEQSAQVSSASEADSSEEGKRAYADLAKFYKNAKEKPDYQKFLSLLNSPDAAGDSAARYILALLKQSLADETNGRDSLVQTPFWGQGPRSTAREFRKEVATEFSKSASGDRALDIAFWLVVNDKEAYIPKTMIDVFKRGSGNHATEVYRDLLQQPYSVAEFTSVIIDQASVRHLVQLRPEIESLESHYRQSVRDAARQAARNLGFKPAATFVPEVSFTPWLVKQLQAISAMVYTTIPPNSRFCQVTLQATGGDYSDNIFGWVLNDDSDAIEILDTFGCRTKYSKHSRPETIFAKKVIPYELKWAAIDLATVRKRLNSPGELRNDSAKLSRQGSLSAQFESRSVGVPEALVASWCYTRDDKARAAEVLFPCINSLSDDRELTTVVRNAIGTTYYHQMLNDFTESRTYPAAEKLADHLMQPQFKDCFFQPQVRELSSQLKSRPDDFNKFSLPEKAEWNRMKASMSAAQQIDYLAPRLRLLHGRQPGQPARVDFAYPQYKEAPASLYTLEGRSPTAVIDPYSELSAIMKNPENIPAFLPYVKDKNYISTVGYWRDFAPERNLYRVRDFVAELINKAAQTSLIDVSKLDGQSATEEATALDNVLLWCQSHKSKSEHDLSLETLHTTKSSQEFRNILQPLIEAKDASVAPIIVERIKDFPGSQNNIAGDLYALDLPTSVQTAKHWLDIYQLKLIPPGVQPHEGGYQQAERLDPAGVRVWSALILLRHDNDHGERAIKELSSLLSLSKNNRPIFLGRGRMQDYIIVKLLECKNPKARVLAGSMCNELFEEPDTSNYLTPARRLFVAGCPEALSLFIHELSKKEDKSKIYITQNGQKLNPWKADVFVQSLLSLDFGGSIDPSFTPWHPKDFKYNSTEPIATREQKLEELKQWFTEQFAAIQQHRPGTLHLEKRFTSADPEIP